MKKLTIFFTLILLVCACIPDHVKEKMNEGMSNAQRMMGDWEFQRALGQIELHKLRSGNYPNSLTDLEFLTAMDSSMSNFVEYTRLDSGYELNLKMKFPSLNGKETEGVDLKYPPEFWNGLGCVKSNVK